MDPTERLSGDCSCCEAAVRGGEVDGFGGKVKYSSSSSSSSSRGQQAQLGLRRDLLTVLAFFLLWHNHHVTATRLPVEFLMHQPHHLRTKDAASRVFYATGNGEQDLPICSPHSVCNKVDLYDNPWIERQCRCPGDQTCSKSLEPGDGHTIIDKSRLFKTCEPVKKLPKCRPFRDITWTFVNYPDNTTQQIMHCVCPKNSVAYIVKRQAYQSESGLGFQYSFACSPQSRLRCQRKEPCRLFTVKKRVDFEEVNTNTLCQCPHGHKCPKKHVDVGVIPGKVYTEDMIRTYSAYCM